MHVFILCSGFGLFLSYKKRALTYFGFLKRRFGKVYFSYITVVLLTFVWISLTEKRLPWYQLASHVFLFKMFSPSLDESMGVQMWFISTIIQFYLVFYLLCQIKAIAHQSLRSSDTVLLIACFCCSMLWLAVVYLTGHNGDRNWSSFFITYLWEFYLGMYIAQYYYDHGRLPLIEVSYIKLLSCFLIFFAIYIVLSTSGSIIRVFNDPFSLGAYLSLALLVYRSPLGLINHFIKRVSKYSYELYLLHILIFSICFYYLSEINLTLSVVVSLAVAFTASYLYYRITSRISLPLIGKTAHLQ